MLSIKSKLTKGFIIVELMVSVMIATIIVGGLIYIVGESNFYLSKQMYRENVKKYADNVMNDIFLSTINANDINIENQGQIICGFKTVDGLVDSLKVYDFRVNQGIFVDGKPLENMFALLIPEAEASEHLKYLAKISRKLMNLDFRADIKKAELILEVKRRMHVFKNT